ncbi:adenine deaminase [Bacteroidota bacterium]
MKIEGNLIDLHKREIYPAALKIADGKIISIERTNTKHQNYILPGFVDAHVHIESSMVGPGAFAETAIQFGTLGIVSDPHEIANVMGLEGVYYMIECANQVPVKIRFGAPSCVPATMFESSGSKLGIEEINELFDHPKITYLSEMMNYPGVIQKDPEVLEKINAAIRRGYQIDGHAPGLVGEDLKKYVEEGISTDHECYTLDEAYEKIKSGMKIQIREGSGAKNFNTLLPLLAEYPDRIMFCSDDLHPDDLLKGHIDRLVVRAIKRGYDLFDTLRAASLNAINHYNLDLGSCKVEDPADFIIIDSLDTFQVKEVYIEGELMYDEGGVKFKAPEPDAINKFDINVISEENFRIISLGDLVQVIETIDGELITKKSIATINSENSFAVSDPERDFLKIAVINRYHQEPPSVGFVKGFGLGKGAIASSISHDSHNIICVGVSDKEIAATVNWIISNKGGIAVHDGTSVQGLKLEIAGIMSAGSVEHAANKYSDLSRIVKDLGSELTAPFMTLSFMALLVIPELKISDKGLFDVSRFSFTPLFLKEE